MCPIWAPILLLLIHYCYLRPQLGHFRPQFDHFGLQFGHQGPLLGPFELNLVILSIKFAILSTYLANLSTNLAILSPNSPILGPNLAILMAIFCATIEITHFISTQLSYKKTSLYKQRCCFSTHFSFQYFFRRVNLTV